MITEKKVSSSTNCLQAINRTTYAFLPSITNNPNDSNQKIYKQPLPLAKSPITRLNPANNLQHNRNPTPVNGNSSYSYIYTSTLQDMKTKDPSPSSLIKILKPEMYPKCKLAGKKLELVGRTVVSTHKIAPRVKFLLPPGQVSNEYSRKLAGVKSKYFCFDREKKIKIKKAILKNEVEDRVVTEISAQREDREFYGDRKKEKFINYRALSITAWEQDA